MAKKKILPKDEKGTRPRIIEKDEETWAARIVKSKRFQTKYSGKWQDNRRLIVGDKDGAASPPLGDSGNAVAYGWGLYESLETTIYVQNPETMVTSRDPAQDPTSKRLTKIVKYDIDQMNVKDVGNLALLDTFICGYGAVIERVDTYHKYDEAGNKTGEVEYQDFAVERLDPKDVLFDYNARRLDLSDSRWLCVAWYPTITDLRNDVDIKSLPESIDSFPETSEYTRSTATPEGPAERQAATLTGDAQTGGEKDPAFKTICVWECYDKINHEVVYVTDYHHFVLGKTKWPVNLRFGSRDLFPVTLLYQHPVPGRFYPVPEAELIAPQLREINIIEGIISEDTRTKWRKYVTLSGILTEDQKSKITDTSVKNALIFVDPTQLMEVLGLTSQAALAGIDLTKLVVPLQDVAAARDLFGRYEMLTGEIQHIVGYGPSERGGLPSTRSAREAMMINADKERKLDKRRSRVADFYRLLSMKHVRFLQKYMVIDRYARVFPKAVDLEDWIKYDRVSITGDFEFDVIAGSSVPKTTEVRKASEQALFQAIAPILQQAGLPLRPAFERLAEYMEWDGVDQLFNGVKEKAQAAAVAMAGFQKGQIPPEALLNVFAQLLLVELGPGEFALIQKQLADQGGGTPGAPLNSSPAAPPGQRGDPFSMATAAGVPPPGGAP